MSCLSFPRAHTWCTPPGTSTRGFLGMLLIGRRSKISPPGLNTGTVPHPINAATRFPRPPESSSHMRFEGGQSLYLAAGVDQEGGFADRVGGGEAEVAGVGEEAATRGDRGGEDEQAPFVDVVGELLDDAVA